MLPCQTKRKGPRGSDAPSETKLERISCMEPARKTPNQTRDEIARAAYQKRQECLARIAAAYADNPVLQRLKDAQEQVAHWEGWDWRDPVVAREHADAAARDLALLDTAARAAIRAGFIEHPYVQVWLGDRRVFGDRPALRAIKNAQPGLTAGVSKPLRLADIWLLAVFVIGLENSVPCAL